MPKIYAHTKKGKLEDWLRRQPQPVTIAEAASAMSALGVNISQSSVRDAFEEWRVNGYVDVIRSAPANQFYWEGKGRCGRLAAFPQYQYEAPFQLKWSKCDQEKALVTKALIWLRKQTRQNDISLKGNMIVASSPISSRNLDRFHWYCEGMFDAAKGDSDPYGS